MRPPPATDQLVAQAMDRVLDAERAARTEVEHCETQMHEQLEAAREQRRQILERARNRIVALHTRVGHVIATQEARLREQGQRGLSEAEFTDQARLNAALARLASKLTGGE